MEQYLGCWQVKVDQKSNLSKSFWFEQLWYDKSKLIVCLKMNSQYNVQTYFTLKI
jgi:hypothetical protein